MDVAEKILALVSPARLGDEVVPGARLVATSTELGPRLTFDCGGVEVHIEVAPADASRPSAARSGRLMFGYRAGSSDDAVRPEVGLALSRAVARLAMANEDAVLEEMAQAARADAQRSGGASRVREVTVSHLLESAGAGVRKYSTLSPYVGCLIGCRFCYAQSRVGITRAFEGLPVVPWGSYVDVRVNAPEILARELAEPSRPLRPIKFCPIVSDPYQAVERKYQITRQCLEVIRDAKEPPPTLILTRSSLLARDAGLLASIPRSWGGVSLPTVDETVLRHFEPRGSSAAERLELLRALRRAGARTLAVVQPMLPGSTSALADALASTVDSVSLDVLHGLEGASDDFRAPEYARAASPAWQMDQALALKAALEERGVAVWRGELPPDLS